MKRKKRPSQRPKLSILHERIPKRLQEMLHFTRLAELGRLSASVAHEINNPLMVAQGFAENIELILDRDQIPRDEIRLQILEVIKACQRISRIITKMNRMSRSQKLRLHVVDLAEIALNAVDFVKVQLRDLDVQVEFQFDRPLPIQCDAVQIEQIILNIISNALFALEQRNSNRTIKISFEELGKWQQIKIWNNGPAIPKNVQEKLMTPFFTTKEEGQGTGLGLAVSKSIMNVHGGDLTFKSEGNHGTEFILSFPRPKENPWKEQARHTHGPIIIIDPQANYRRTLQEKFRLLGFRVETFSHFDDGLSAIHKNPEVSGVFVDVVPGLQKSFQQVRALRRDLGPRALIYTISGFPSARDVSGNLKGVGATECFEKPIHADNFSLILKQLDSHTFAATNKVTA